MINSDEKQQVHDFWNEAACGEVLYLSGTDSVDFEAQSRRRYELEPFILDFAQFEKSKGKKVLEIGTRGPFFPLPGIFGRVGSSAGFFRMLGFSC